MTESRHRELPKCKQKKVCISIQYMALILFIMIGRKIKKVEKTSLKQR